MKTVKILRDQYIRNKAQQRKKRELLFEIGRNGADISKEIDALSGREDLTKKETRNLNKLPSKLEKLMKRHNEMKAILKSLSSANSEIAKAAENIYVKHEIKFSLEDFINA